MTIKLVAHNSGFKVLYDYERVGDIHKVSPTEYRITDIRDKVVNVASIEAACSYFLRVRWRIYLGPSALATPRNATYLPKVTKLTKPRWALR
jgi:hypothetical protein